jgi:hypothetical protein
MNTKSINIKDFLLGFLTCLCILLLSSISGCGRTLSRLGLGDEKLNLPKDFKSMVSVSLHKESNGDTVKDLTYETTEGKYRSVEYRDKIWHLEGGITWEIDK